MYSHINFDLTLDLYAFKYNLSRLIHNNFYLDIL